MLDPVQVENKIKGNQHGQHYEHTDLTGISLSLCPSEINFSFKILLKTDYLQNIVQLQCSTFIYKLSIFLPLMILFFRDSALFNNKIKDERVYFNPRQHVIPRIPCDYNLNKSNGKGTIYLLHCKLRHLKFKSIWKKRYMIREIRWHWTNGGQFCYEKMTR